MSILTNIFSYLFADTRTTIISLIIAFLVYKLSKFYIRVLSLPPGPIPLPIVGNILFFRGTKEHWSIEMRRLPKKYGSVFTFWLGATPFVFISDIDIAREAFRKNEFSGRPESYFGNQFSNDKYSDVVFTDYGHQWEALRRVAHSAVQKYSTNDKLAYLVSDCVDQTIKLIIDREGFDKPFSPFTYVYFTFLNIILTSAFGKSYDIDDPEFKKFKYSVKDVFEENGTRSTLWEFMPIVKYLDRDHVKRFESGFADLIDRMHRDYKKHYIDYDESVCRDFCDALISAKNEALKEGKESAPYLKDENLAATVFDLLLAGTDTSQGIFLWILLILALKPNVGKKLRQEIESEIGDRIATHEDRSRCDYAMAVISETLRFRNVVPNGVFHKAVVSSKIGDYTIPEGMGVFVMQGNILTDEKYWSNPDQFIPERFLENDKYVTTKPKAFIPFSVGRRVCLGEKLAIADLFLVLVRFLQSTSDYDIVLHDNCGLLIDPNCADTVQPLDYKISLKQKQKSPEHINL